MNKERLKEIITQLKDITAELESEVYSDLEAYKTYGGSTLTYDDTSDKDELCDWNTISCCQKDERMLS